MPFPSNIVPENRLPNNLLLASPALRDGCFDKSVVFMVKHSSTQGSIGVILNHDTGKTVGDLLSTDDFKPLADLPVYFGGPVENDQLVFASFEWTDSSSLRCEFHVPLKTAVEVHKNPNKMLRVFVGHSAWTKGQLKLELSKNAWITAFTRPQNLDLPADETLWRDTLSSLSTYHHLLSLTPENLTLN